MGDKERLMVTVAKMYYDSGMSQKEVAEQLGVSRGYICQLLEQARKVGIVEIKVNSFSSEESELEGYVRKMFALRRVKIFHTPPHSGTNQLTREIVEEACGYLDTIIKSGMTIGFSWGETIYQISSSMENHPQIKNVTAIPLCGGISNLMKQIYVSEISTNIANAYHGTPLFIPLPAILQNSEIRNSLKSDRNISSLLEKGKNADVALFTVGVPGDQNALYRSGYLDADSWEKLAGKGAVGDVCAHFIKADGEICDQELDRRTISVSMENFAAIPNKICIAVGAAKAQALLGALRKKYVDVLITSDETIQTLLRLI